MRNEVNKNAILEATEFVLLMAVIYEVQMTQGGMIYIPYLTKIGQGIRGILWVLPQTFEGL
jgi:hypothetical protein